MELTRKEKEAEANGKVSPGSRMGMMRVRLLKCLERRMRIALLRHVLRMLVWIWWMDHRLDARYSLLLRRVGVRGVLSSVRPAWHQVRGARFFIEVRNAYAAIFFVVGTIVLLLLR